jgi:hypothetical protein
LTKFGVHFPNIEMKKAVQRVTQVEDVIEHYASEVISAHSEYEKELNKFHQRMRVFRDKVANLRHGIGLMARKPASPKAPKQYEYVPSPVKESPPRNPRLYKIQSDERRRFDFKTSPKKIGRLLCELS